MVVVALGAMALVGCTSPKYNYTPTTQSLSEPPVGSVNTSYVGDSLLSQGILAKYEGIKVTAPARVSWAYTVTPGNLKKLVRTESPSSICLREWLILRMFRKLR